MSILDKNTPVAAPAAEVKAPTPAPAAPTETSKEDFWANAWANRGV